MSVSSPDSNPHEHNTQEGVALKLMQLIMAAEGMATYSKDESRRPTRDYILKLYWQCLCATKGQTAWNLKEYLGDS